MQRSRQLFQIQYRLVRKLPLLLPIRKTGGGRRFWEGFEATFRLGLDQLEFSILAHGTYRVILMPISELEFVTCRDESDSHRIAECLLESGI